MIFEKDYLKMVADTILQQLRTNLIELMAWGSWNFYCIERKIDDKVYPALIFSIKTPKVKAGGKIIISYDKGSDEYIVEAIRFIGLKEFPIGMTKGVCWEDLHRVINNLIETEETLGKIKCK